jgi:hypothetical protein
MDLTARLRGIRALCFSRRTAASLASAKEARGKSNNLMASLGSMGKGGGEMGSSAAKAAENLNDKNEAEEEQPVAPGVPELVEEQPPAGALDELQKQVCGKAQKSHAKDNHVIIATPRDINADLAAKASGHPKPSVDCVPESGASGGWL